MASRFVAAAAAAAILFVYHPASASLPPPLPMVCLSNNMLGCFSDSLSPRTFPVCVSYGGGDAFYNNQTLETCAYLCKTLQPSLPIAAVENGGQCFCTNASGIASAVAGGLLRPPNECNATCAGNPFQPCGGPWRVQAYNFSCAPYSPSSQPWQDPALPAAARVADLVSRLSPTQLMAQLTQNGADLYGASFQLPRYIVSQECLAGFNGEDIYIAPAVNHTHSSAFPQPVNMGNTWDAELVREIASAISDEARAAFNFAGRPSLTCMSPGLNVNRDPRWGRNSESFSEDPSLIATLGTAYIHGIQLGAKLSNASASGYLKIMAVPKHLGAYSVECFNASGGANDYPACPVYRSFFNAVVDEMDLRETYLPAWRAAVVEGGAQGLMCSYNAINGVPSCTNGDILRGVLEGEWGMRGFVISDADAVAQIYNVPDAAPPPGHNFAHSLLDAAIGALLNGTSISLEDTDVQSAAYALMLPVALAAGRISIDDLRAAATRALTPRFLVGLYDPPALVPWNSIPGSVIESEAHHALARRAAAQSFVLLKNAGAFLPLRSPSEGGPSVIAMVGPAANETWNLLGGYTGTPTRAVSIWDGVSAMARALGAQPTLDAGMGATALAAVAAADVAIVVLTSESEGESRDRERIGLPAAQAAFLSTLSGSTSTPLIVCVVSGGAVDVSPAVDDVRVPAVLALYTGGMEAGSALADVLYGVVNPSGALAHTVYRASWTGVSDFLDMGMRTQSGRGHRYLQPAAAAQHVLFPFGWGLSYTNWTTTISTVSPPSRSLSVAALGAGGNFTLGVDVVNSGSVTGDRVVFIVVLRVNAEVDQQWPVQWLPRAGFSVLRGITPGGRGTARLVIDGGDLSRWDAVAHAFTVRVGNYSVLLRDAPPESAVAIEVMP